MFTPRLELYPQRVKENASYIFDICKKHGVEVTAVSKVVCAHPDMVKVFVDCGAEIIADSRIENLQAIKKMGYDIQLMMLRIPTLSRLDDLVAVADLSLVSSLSTMQGLGKAASKIGKIHKGILMVDLGDLREGVLYDKALAILAEISKNPIDGFELAGLGTNLACFGGVIPSNKNTSKLIELKNECEKKFAMKLDIISGGNSSGLPLLLSGKLPKGINNYRVGEAIVLGRNVIDRSPLAGTRQDTMIAVSEIIELEKKSSKPIGEIGQDAFGNTPSFTDRGDRLRAICNIGRQDVDIEGLTPVDKNIEILGGSSDHLILDLEDCTQDCKEKLKVGDEIAFYPDYSALLALLTSPYVKKVSI